MRDCVVNDKDKNVHFRRQDTCVPPTMNLEKFWNRSVYANCSNGRMSRLEQEVDPIIDKLVSGTDFNQLSLSEVETLAI